MTFFSFSSINFGKFYIIVLCCDPFIEIFNLCKLGKVLKDETTESIYVNRSTTSRKMLFEMSN